MTITPEVAPLQGVLCFSHLRWNFVFQRPQHLLTRMTKKLPVHFWEEPIFQARQEASVSVSCGPDEVTVVTPLLPDHLTAAQVDNTLRRLLDAYLLRSDLSRFVAWYYTPMALAFTSHLVPDAIVYDCMDELAAFQSAPPELIQREQRLFAMADVVFAGGASLYESKRNQHGNVHLFPSSIDRKHFAVARRPVADPADQEHIPHPRIGFFGVLDERFDIDLLRSVAEAQPEWHFVLIGPIVKIRPEDLPQGSNLHYLGSKQYTELPAYLANWDVAMLPFARNASTRFISPTKTPEYLAAGKPVVSTSIRDVIKPYGDRGMVRIADDAKDFAEAIAASLQPADPRWLAKVDDYLGSISWDRTFEEMMIAIDSVLKGRSQPAQPIRAELSRSGKHV